jgi:hypothetical protein
MRRQKSVQTESGRGFRKAACILRSAANVAIVDFRVDSATVDGNKTPHEIVLLCCPSRDFLQCARVAVLIAGVIDAFAPVCQCVKTLK